MLQWSASSPLRMAPTTNAARPTTHRSTRLLEATVRWSTLNRPQDKRGLGWLWSAEATAFAHWRHPQSASHSGLNNGKVNGIALVHAYAYHRPGTPMQNRSSNGQREECTNGKDHSEGHNANQKQHLPNCGMKKAICEKYHIYQAKYINYALKYE